MAFVSCVGFSGSVAFRSRGCSLAPVCAVKPAVQAGMGTVPRGALTLVGAGTARGGDFLGACNAPAGGGSELLSERLVPFGSRKAIFSCRAAGLDGDDYPRFELNPMKLPVPDLLDFLAKKTSVVLDRVHLPKPEDYVPDEQRPSVSSEIRAIQAGCKELAEETEKLSEKQISLAAIELVGLHARIFNLFTFCRVQKEWPIYTVGAPSSLEIFTKQTLRRTMSNTVKFYQELQKQPNKDICEPIQEGAETLSDLLVILVKRTTLLLKEIPSILVPVYDAISAPLGNFMSSTTLRELEELQEMCDELREKVGAKDILDNVAFGTFQGIDGRLRYILLMITKCGEKDHGYLLLDGKLRSVENYKSSLVNSMTEVEQCLMEYMKKETE